MVPCVPGGRGQIIARLIRGNDESCGTRDQTINALCVCRRDPGRRQHAGEGAGHVHGRARVRGVRREDRLRDGRTCRWCRIQQADDQVSEIIVPEEYFLLPQTLWLCMFFGLIRYFSLLCPNIFGVNEIFFAVFKAHSCSRSLKWRGKCNNSRRPS